MKTVLTAVLACVGLFLISSSLDAHHGFAAYDQTKPVTLSGVVTQFEFVNPHAQIYFDVKSDKGEVQQWGIELATPGLLVRRGWSTRTMKQGDQITVTCFRAKNGSNSMARCTKIERGGEELSLTEGN